MSTSDTMSLFAGNANPALALDIAKHLQTPLGRAYVGRFSDGEVNVELMDNVRGRDVFIVQSTCPPANEQPDGAAGDGGRVPARVRRAHHRGGAVLRLFAPGSPTARDALGDHGEAGGEHDRRAPVWTAC